MGLTTNLAGIQVVDDGLLIRKRTPHDKIVALAGNPNVGKSTVFNSLTGLNQHTGNWPGKTVSSAQGFCKSDHHAFTLVDLPGAYSLLAHSAEEEIARYFLCFDDPDAVVVVCDATCLARNMNLVLQVLEITRNVVVCVNLMDEARRKGIRIDTQALARRLGVPVVGTVARKRSSLNALLSAIDLAVDHTTHEKRQVVTYPDVLEEAVALVETSLVAALPQCRNSRWLALQLLDRDPSLLAEIRARFGDALLENGALQSALEKARMQLTAQGLQADALQDMIVSSLTSAAEAVCSGSVTYENACCDRIDRRMDRILTGKRFGYPIMALLLLLILWLTIVGANYPSAWLSDAFAWLQAYLSEGLAMLHAPVWLHDALILGVYRTLAWVVSVMLPPMAIFFPLFTLLEDAGYLPRIAYNLDKPFQRCHACGKQALTMCMGFGCNAAGVVGCRIIDSPRERLLAILTNNFVPCNGRFPTFIAIITMFFIGATGGMLATALSALLLTLVIVLGIGATFAVTKLLSETLLRGTPSAFTLELPPYRKPQVGRVIVRSMLDRTLFVLGRAVAVAAPAGLVLWLAANIYAGDASLLHHASAFLDPFGRSMGLDGVILIAFILGLPANEIVMPIIIMAYMAQGSLTEAASLHTLRTLLIDNGWTWITALNTMLFSLLHWPCATTLITIRKETGSWKWTALSATLPTFLGMAVCALVAVVGNLFLP